MYYNMPASLAKKSIDIDLRTNKTSNKEMTVNTSVNNFEEKVKLLKAQVKFKAKCLRLGQAYYIYASELFPDYTKLINGTKDKDPFYNDANIDAFLNGLYDYYAYRDNDLYDYEEKERMKPEIESIDTYASTSTSDSAIKVNDYETTTDVRMRELLDKLDMFEARMKHLEDGIKETHDGIKNVQLRLDEIQRGMNTTCKTIEIVH